MTVNAAGTLPDGIVDVVVIGGGAAGLNGALMLARSRRAVVVVDSGTPRNAPAAAVHGLLGADGTPPAELPARGRAEVRRYGGVVVSGEVVAAVPAPAEGEDLAAQWGREVVHCPYCHGWEVRDEPIGILATGPGSVHHALLFRQLTSDLVYFTRDTALDDDALARFAARGIRIVDAPVREVVQGDDGGVAGVRLADGTLVARRVLAVASTVWARTEGLDGLGLPMEDLPGGVGRRFVSGMAGVTGVAGCGWRATPPTRWRRWGRPPRPGHWPARTSTPTWSRPRPTPPSPR